MKYYLSTLLLKGVKQNHIIKAKDKTEAINRTKKECKGILLKVEEISPPARYVIKELLSDLQSPNFES